jgi:hypothetical protein
VATFKDDGYSAFKEITRDGFGELIAAIEADQVDVVIVRDIDRLTRNLTDWNAFEKACVRHGVRLSAYTGGDLDLSTAEGAYYGGMETLRARRESAVNFRYGRPWSCVAIRIDTGRPVSTIVARVGPHPPAAWARTTRYGGLGNHAGWTRSKGARECAALALGLLLGLWKLWVIFVNCCQNLPYTESVSVRHYIPTGLI